ILTINGLTAADAVLVPVQCETLSRRGVGQLLETIEDVRAYTNPDLAVLGVVATMFDGRTRLANEVLASIPDTWDLAVLGARIANEDPSPFPSSWNLLWLGELSLKLVKVAETPSRSRSALEQATASAPAAADSPLAVYVLVPSGARPSPHPPATCPHLGGGMA